MAPASSVLGVRRPSVWLAALLAVAAAFAVEVAASGLADSTSDTGAALGAAWRSVWRPLTALPLDVPLLLCAVAALHYLAAALAAGAAAGVALPRRELLRVQFAAAAANRVSPAGIGGATVLGRYFTRRGGLSPARSVAAVSCLTAGGAVADVACFAVVVLAGSWLGVAGVRGELPALSHRAASLVPTLPAWWPFAVASGLIGAAAVLVATRRRRERLLRVVRSAADYGAGLAAMLTRPGRIAVLMTASATTTLVLAVGFAAAATLGPAHPAVGGFAALVVGYFVAAALGNALPTPGGIGSADAAFVGVLAAAGSRTGAAVATVLVFRLITFWSPAVLGVVAARSLRRAGAL